MLSFIANNVAFSNVDIQSLRIEYFKIEPSDKRIVTDSPTDRLFFVVNGFATVSIVGKVFERVSRDGVFFSPKNSECKFENRANEPFEMYVIELETQPSEKFFDGIGFPKGEYFRTLSGQGEIVADLYKAAEDNTLSSSYKCLSEFYNLLSNMGRVEDFTAESEPCASEYVARAKKYIHMQYHLNITVNMIANEVYLNRSYFSTIFKKETGMTPLEYLIDFRIQQACKLLAMGKSVTDTAMLTGFGTPSRFAAHFKKIKNETPSEYRVRSSQGGKYEKNQ